MVGVVGVCGVSLTSLPLGDAFSLLDVFNGLPGPGPGLTSLSSMLCLPVLFGEPTASCCRPALVGLLGSSRMAFSKTFGSSFAPGGNLFLLGLPCGVVYGVVKSLLVGVAGLAYSLPERVCNKGGGIGSLKSPFNPPGESGVAMIQTEEGIVLVLVLVLEKG